MIRLLIVSVFGTLKLTALRKSLGHLVKFIRLMRVRGVA
jgi:hypothetical protein